MLFGLHEKLRHAHQDEWPKLHDLVVAHGKINVLGQAVLQKAGEEVADGRGVLRYLHKAEHNMVHFACHCVPVHGEDVLLLSLLRDASDITSEGVVSEPDEIRLGTKAFLRAPGVFETKQPLVFLNACQTTGDKEAIGLGFTLPDKFVRQKAAAVIATVCRVPDIFAAAFARKFYELFLEDRAEIGEALRATRVHFWKEYRNPLGLAYGLYSSPFYRVGERAKEGGLLT
jgi:CHAT domain-containing protein